jgi:chromate reductase, NAD(P)H dehydrogenase (quinone)
MARKVVIIVGSTRANSINLKLANALVKLAAPELRFEFAKLDDLPVFNQDREHDPIPAVIRVRAQIGSADALLFITPEHNRSIPAVLKNVLDWVSRPFGKSQWRGRPAAIAGASAGALGTALAQAHLRSILGCLDVPTLGQPEVYIRVSDDLITRDGDVTNDGTRKFLQSFMDIYANWVARFHERPRMLSASNAPSIGRSMLAAARQEL